MPPKGMPKKETANFRTFESQARLLAAVIASMDNPKLDYKSKPSSPLPSLPSSPSSRLGAPGHWPGASLIISCKLRPQPAGGSGESQRRRQRDIHPSCVPFQSNRPLGLSSTDTMAVSGLPRNRPVHGRLVHRVQHRASLPDRQGPGVTPPGSREEGN